MRLLPSSSRPDERLPGKPAGLHAASRVRVLCRSVPHMIVCLVSHEIRVVTRHTAMMPHTVMTREKLLNMTVVMRHAGPEMTDGDTDPGHDMCHRVSHMQAQGMRNHTESRNHVRHTIRHKTRNHVRHTTAQDTQSCASQCA